MPRLLFCSYHCYWDPSSGAALCTRELLELLAQRGWCCRAFCGPHLDFEQNNSVSDLLAAQQIRFEQRQKTAGAAPCTVYRFEHGGVPVQIFYSPVARPFQAATREEGACFLALYERLLERFQPDLVFTYGGDWVAEQIIAQAKRRGIPVVFALHNFAYNGAELFRPVDAVLVPSGFAQAHYRRTLGLKSTPSPARGIGPEYAALRSILATSRLSIPSRTKAYSSSPASPPSWHGGGLIFRSCWSKAAAKPAGCNRRGSISPPWEILS